MRTLPLAAAIAAACLCFAPVEAGAQSHMGNGQARGAHPGGMHFGSRPGTGHFHPGAFPPGAFRPGTFPHAGGFPHGGFPHGGFPHGGLPHGGFPHGGHFVHGFHGGFVGTWWVSGGVWYPWYPVYASAVPAYSYTAPMYSGPDVWYYCASAGNYYPYVQVCPEGWVPVSPYGPGSAY